jgi:hypothetical protein
MGELDKSNKKQTEEMVSVKSKIIISKNVSTITQLDDSEVESKTNVSRI